jgi:hypothetical protein
MSPGGHLDSHQIVNALVRADCCFEVGMQRATQALTTRRLSLPIATKLLNLPEAGRMCQKSSLIEISVVVSGDEL